MENSFFFDATPVDLYALPDSLTSQYILIPPTVKVISLLPPLSPSPTLSPSPFSLIAIQDAYLVFLLKRFSELTSIIVFVATKEECEAVHVMLQDLQFSSAHLHSFMKQEDRNRTLNQIKSGKVFLHESKKTREMKRICVNVFGITFMIYNKIYQIRTHSNFGGYGHC
jgi:hypothetical protein